MIAPDSPAIQEFRFADDGETPNHPVFPVLLYRHVINASDREPISAFEEAFRENRWQGIWRWGVYSFHHYHSKAHEVLGVVRGTARLQLGGRSGEAVEVSVGDTILLPAGTGHKCIECSDDFLVVGAYPPGQSADLIRSGEGDIAQARNRIMNLAAPSHDPLFGSEGPTTWRWREGDVRS